MDLSIVSRYVLDGGRSVRCWVCDKSENCPPQYILGSLTVNLVKDGEDVKNEVHLSERIHFWSENL